MQTLNLLNDKANAYTKQIATQYTPRAPFAYTQQLSDDVVCKTVYTDDVDVCFVFTLHNSDIEVDVYCNYNCTYCVGYVYGTESTEVAAQVLAKHFNLQVRSAQIAQHGTGQDCSVFFVTA